MTTRLITLIAFVVISLLATIEYERGGASALEARQQIDQVLCRRSVSCPKHCRCGTIWNNCSCICKPCPPPCCRPCLLKCGMGYWYTHDKNGCVTCHCKD